LPTSLPSFPPIKLRHGDRITGELVMPARDGANAEFPIDLEPRLAAALRGRGIPSALQPSRLRDVPDEGALLSEHADSQDRSQRP
jgi:hypothetical protein